MKRLLIWATALLLCAACTKDNEPTVTEPAWVATLNSYLSGTWYGERYSGTFNTTDHEDIVFAPFATKEVVSLFGTFNAHGVAVITKYTNDHLLETTERCLYSIGDEYKKENGYFLSFYPCDESNEVISREDKRILRKTGETQFRMRSSGLTIENELEYSKQ